MKTIAAKGKSASKIEQDLYSALELAKEMTFAASPPERRPQPLGSDEIHHLRRQDPAALYGHRRPGGQCCRTDRCRKRGCPVQFQSRPQDARQGIPVAHRHHERRRLLRRPSGRRTNRSLCHVNEPIRNRASPLGGAFSLDRLTVLPYNNSCI